MTELIIKKGFKRTQVLLYDDTDMPVGVFQKANKYWMLDDNIGSSIDDIYKKHLQKIVAVAGDKEKVIKEVSNLSILFNSLINEVNVKSLAFASLVYSIDGVELRDRSKENLEKIIARLSGLGLTNEELKKKSMPLKSGFSQIWRSPFRFSLTVQKAKKAGWR